MLVIKALVLVIVINVNLFELKLILLLDELIEQLISNLNRYSLLQLMLIVIKVNFAVGRNKVMHCAVKWSQKQFRFFAFLFLSNTQATPFLNWRENLKIMNFILN